MSSFDTEYGPVFGELLTVEHQRALDEGVPNEENRISLQTLSVDRAFAHTHVTDADCARCCVSAVWLLYDFLDESHTISQGIETAEGSFWHAIMHRREGDFSNAKYWFRKVGQHPALELLASDARDPFAFVDSCQSALSAGGAEVDYCQQLQQSEWELLFDYCYRQAIGA